MERLSSQDSLFVYSEASGWPLHMGSVAILDPGDLPDGFDIHRLRAHFEARLPQLPIFRRRVVRVPAGLDRPVWVEVPDLDLAGHVRAVGVPSPGGPRELAAVVSDLHTPALDLDRPPWEVWLLEGLEGGRVAVYTKLHHSLVDGVRGREVQEVMYDVTPDAAQARGDEPLGDVGQVSRRRLATEATGHLATLPLRLTRTAAHLIGAGARLGTASLRRRTSGASLPLTAPRTSFNGRISDRRAFAYGSVDLAPVRAMARAENATVNDVVLMLLAGALRRYLTAHDELPARSLTAVVPVGVAAAAGASQDAGNAWEAMFTSLATDLADPVERLHAISRSTAAGKSAQGALGHDVWSDLLDVPPLLVGLIARGYAGMGLSRVHPTVVNLIVSNVRGAPVPLYLAGARLEGLFPMGPIADGMGLNVTLLGGAHTLDFGFTTCPDLVPDPWELVQALQVEAAELPEPDPAPSA